MRRRRVLALLLGACSLALLYAVSCSVLPPRIDEKRNAVYGSRPFDRGSQRGSALLGNLLVGDLHADSLIWSRDLSQRHNRGHVDVPRLQQANVAIQVFAVATKVPKRISGSTDANQLNLLTLAAVLGAWPPSTWWSLIRRAEYHAARLAEYGSKSDGYLSVVRTAADLERFLATRGRSRRVGGILAIEGLHPIGSDLNQINRLYASGYRIMGLTHHFDNAIGGSSTGVRKGGLTSFGRTVVSELERRSIIIDLAHASPALIRDVTALARRPLIVSHTGVRGTCDRNRNLSDEEVRLVAGTGGVIGIGYWSGATCGRDAAAIARAIRRAVDIAGIDHIALGSDFDGDRMPFDVTGLIQVVDALLEVGFTTDQIGKIAGGNMLRVLRSGLPKS